MSIKFTGLDFGVVETVDASWSPFWMGDNSVGFSDVGVVQASALTHDKRCSLYYLETDCLGKRSLGERKRPIDVLRADLVCIHM